MLWFHGLRAKHFCNLILELPDDEGNEKNDCDDEEKDELSSDALFFLLAMIAFPARSTYTLTVAAVATVEARTTAGFPCSLESSHVCSRVKMLKYREVSALMNRFVLRNLLNELHDAAVASQARGKAELFTIETSGATAREPAIIISGTVTRHKNLEVIVQFAIR